MQSASPFRETSWSRPWFGLRAECIGLHPDLERTMLETGLGLPDLVVFQPRLQILRHENVGPPTALSSL